MWAILEPRRNGIDTNDSASYSVAVAMGNDGAGRQTSMSVATQEKAKNSKKVGPKWHFAS